MSMQCSLTLTGPNESLVNNGERIFSAVTLQRSVHPEDLPLVWPHINMNPICIYLHFFTYQSSWIASVKVNHDIELACLSYFHQCANTALVSTSRLEHQGELAEDRQQWRQEYHQEIGMHNKQDQFINGGFFIARDPQRCPGRSFRLMTSAADDDQLAG